MTKISDDSAGLVSIGQLAKAAGVSSRTIRYYEQLGILPEPRRSPGGTRKYPREYGGYIAAALALKDLGFRLEEVKPLARLAAGGRSAPDSATRPPGSWRTRSRRSPGRSRCCGACTTRCAFPTVICRSPRSSGQRCPHGPSSPSCSRHRMVPRSALRTFASGARWTYAEIARIREAAWLRALSCC